MNNKVLLIILDGWGITQNPAVSAIAQAKIPFIEGLLKNYPSGQLLTHGMNVGLPEGQMGNSEVGHINLGAGRIVYQDLAKVNLAIKNGSLQNEPTLQKAFHYAKSNNKRVHFMGLLSNGGVHSHVDHLKALLDAAETSGISKYFVHAFTDGRDVDPKSGLGYIKDIQDYLNNTNGKLASVIGRYYAMDRDRRWERIKKAYDLICFGKGEQTNDIITAIEESYRREITDEFIEPHLITENDVPVATISENDVVIFFNFRTDRGRQLTEVLTQCDLPNFKMKKLPLHFVTLTNYDDSYDGIHVIYNKENLTETLGETLSRHGKTQLRIAETEKYPHVTFFFNGGREEAFTGEQRILCPSPKVATYDLKPEMSAYEIRDRIIDAIKNDLPDFICLNFANPDMVGHTGDFKAAVLACETVDKCTEEIVNVANTSSYTTIIIADHGNCEMMVNPDGSPNTAHTTNPVPIMVVSEKVDNLENGILADIAPTVLKLMGIPQPNSMTGKSLI